MFRVRSRSATDEEARKKAYTLSLDGRAGEISCPLLVVAGRQDRLVPWQHAQRLADEAAGPVELLLLDRGNHGCTNIAAHHRPRTADWVAEQLTQ